MPLDSDIREIRPYESSMSWNFPDVQTLRQWVVDLGTGQGHPLVTVLGPTPEYRSRIYNSAAEVSSGLVVLDKSHYCYDWPSKSLFENLIRRVALPSILGSLAVNDELHTEEELVELIDRDARLSEAFKVLWDIRFLVEEEREEEAEAIVHALALWSVGRPLVDADSIKVLDQLGIKDRVTSVDERYDLFFMWIALARFNGIFDRLLLPFDGFERAPDRTEDLEGLVRMASKWSSYGAPLGILVGVPHLNFEMPEGLRKLLGETMV